MSDTSPVSGTPRKAGKALRIIAAAIALGAALIAPAAWAECEKPVAWNLTTVVPAAWSPRLAAEEQVVDLRYVGHSTFLIQSPAGVKIVTDYNDFVRPPVIPDIVTMNIAHSTHYSNRVQPGVKFALQGWGTPERPASHSLIYQDVFVRNVSTNIRDFSGTTMVNGNSIFVFELADLCIAHLGHLHHRLSPEQLSTLGKIDVVLVPVDGFLTLGQGFMLEVLDQIRAPLAIPMHAQNPGVLQRFMAMMIADPKLNYTVRLSRTSDIKLSRATLPAKPEFLVLPGF